MTTTPAIVEILVIGFFAALWMIPCIALLGDIHWDRILSWAKDYAKAYKEWSAAATLAGIMALYQLGWLVNGLSRAIMWYFAEEVRSRLHSEINVDSEKVRANVYQEGSPAVLKDLDLDQSVIRLARAGIVNFLLIALLLLSAGGQTATVATASLAVVVGCVLQWRHRNRRHYERIIKAYKFIQSQKTAAR
jgi:hypothetical protein